MTQSKFHDTYDTCISTKARECTPQRPCSDGHCVDAEQRCQAAHGGGGGGARGGAVPHAGHPCRPARDSPAPRRRLGTRRLPAHGAILSAMSSTASSDPNRRGRYGQCSRSFTTGVATLVVPVLEDLLRRPVLGPLHSAAVLLCQGAAACMRSARIAMGAGHCGFFSCEP